MTTFRGTSGDDHLTGSSGDDNFLLWQGGNDTVDGGSGNDIFRMGGALNAADKLDGGAGKDYLNLDGDYSAGVVFNADTITNIEVMGLIGGHSYNFTLADGNVAAGERLLVKAELLGAGDTLTFNGAAETDGKYYIIAGAGNDTLTGGAHHDVFDLSGGGNDTAHGGGGMDTFLLGTALTTADVIDGGSGIDTLEVGGNFPVGGLGTAIALNPAKISGIEIVKVTDSTNLEAVVVNGDISGGAGLTVDATALTADSVIFSFTNAGTGTITFNGGPGDDIVYFGPNITAADRIDGGGGSNGIALLGDYSGGFTFGSDTLHNIQEILGITTNSYDLTMVDGNVATGQTLTVQDIDPGAGNPHNFFKFDGSAETDGHFALFSSADCNLTGGGLSDTFQLSTANSTVHGGGGDDAVYFGSAFDAAVTAIDGGAGIDLLQLTDVSGTFNFTDTTIQNVENLFINATDGSAISITTTDMNVSAGAVLVVDFTQSGPLAGVAVTFDGSAEQDGSFRIYAPGFAPSLHLTGGAQADQFTLNHDDGTTDNVFNGLGGDDMLNMIGNSGLSTFTFDGGSGNDTLFLTGGGTMSNGFTLTSVETMTLIDATWNVTMQNAMLAAGATLTVDATALSAGNTLTFDGSAELDASFRINGGNGSDSIIGSAMDDIIYGSGGADTLTGGPGADTFAYFFSDDSTSASLDHITDFTHGTDKFALSGLGGTFKGEFTSNASSGTLDGDLAFAFSTHAGTTFNSFVFDFTGVDFNGKSFLVVDTDGSGDYNAGDLVVDITGHVGTITSGDFI
jgi:Ca2+-binding RTX toxin-like protein